MTRLLLISLAALLLAAAAVAQTADDEFLPVDTLMDARQLYSEAMVGTGGNDIGYRRTKLREAIAKYRSIWDFRSQLVSTNPDLIPKAAYKIALCNFRLAELDLDSNKLKSCIDWSDRVELDAPDTVGYWSRFLAGEAHLQLAQQERNRLMAESGVLSQDQKDAIVARLDQARDFYVESSADKAGEKMAFSSRLRQADIAYEKGQALVNAGELLAAREVFLEEANYGELLDVMPSGSGPALVGLLDYSNAMSKVMVGLIFPDTTRFRNNEVNPIADDLGNEEHFRMACLDLVDPQRYTASYDRLSASTRPTETIYWAALARLFSVQSGQYRSAADEFRDFAGRIDDRSAGDFPRLAYLRDEAKRRNYVINIARNRNFNQDSLQYLTRDDAHFLIRVAAYFSAWRSRCLTRLNIFLDNYAAEAGLEQDEILFLRGIAETLGAALEENEQRARSRFRQASQTLRTISPESRYALEGKYIAASCLGNNVVRAWDEAHPILLDLVANHRSIRALRVLASMEYFRTAFDEGGDAALAVTLAKIVRDTASAKGPDFAFLTDDANVIIEEAVYLNVDTTMLVPLDRVPGARGVRCPDSLLMETLGGNMEVVAYESFADARMIPIALRDGFRRTMRNFIQPKRAAALSSTESVQGRRPLYRVSRMTENRDEWAIGIKDTVYINVDWFARIQFDAEGGFTPDPGFVVKARNATLDQEMEVVDSAGYYVVRPEMHAGEILEIEVDGPTFYKTTRDLSCRKPMTADFVIALSNYDNLTRRSEGGWQDAFDHYNDFAGRTTIVHDKARTRGANFPGELRDGVKDNRSWRNFAFDRAGDRVLLVDCALRDKLIVFEDGSQKELSLSGSELNNPEGVAVDDQGIIYVADFGNHRVALFDHNGVFIKELTGAEGSFIFPSRIAIQEDIDGLAVKTTTGDSTAYRESYLMVADMKGIYRFDSRGNFLETVTRFGNGQFSPHLTSALAISGYGRATRMVVSDPHGQQPVAYSGQ